MTPHAREVVVATMIAYDAKCLGWGNFRYISTSLVLVLDSPAHTALCTLLNYCISLRLYTALGYSPAVLVFYMQGTIPKYAGAGDFRSKRKQVLPETQQSWGSLHHSNVWKKLGLCIFFKIFQRSIGDDVPSYCIHVPEPEDMLYYLL